ncbi:hypothetical protein ACLB2K_057332 [Fragaria x ananassa]
MHLLLLASSTTTTTKRRYPHIKGTRNQRASSNVGSLANLLRVISRHRCPCIPSHHIHLSSADDPCILSVPCRAFASLFDLYFCFLSFFTDSVEYKQNYGIAIFKGLAVFNYELCEFEEIWIWEELEKLIRLHPRIFFIKVVYLTRPQSLIKVVLTRPECLGSTCIRDVQWAS